MSSKRAVSMGRCNTDSKSVRYEIPLRRHLLRLPPSLRPSLPRSRRDLRPSRRRQFALLDATKGRLSESFSRPKSKRKFNATTRDGIE
jgi:hypothetical protein